MMPPPPPPPGGGFVPGVPTVGPSIAGLQGKQTIADDDPYGSSGLFNSGGGWRNNNKRNYGGMFGEEDGGDGGLFSNPTPVN